MASRATLAVMVVCLVAAPGCNAFGGSDTGPVETLTPVPVTADGPAQTHTPGSTSGSPPPGVSPSGTVDVDCLVAAHESSLANRTYRWEFSVSVTGKAGPFNPNVTRVALVGNEETLIKQTSPVMSTSRTLYIVDGTGYLRSDNLRGVRYDTLQQTDDHHSLAFSGALLERYLTGVTVDLTPVEVDGQTYYRLYAADAGVPLELQEETFAVRDYTLTAYVTPEGFVRTVAVEYDRVEDGERHRVTTRYDYTDLDNVTVARPDWMSWFRTVDTPSDSRGNGTSPTDSPGGNDTVTSDGETPTADGQPTTNGTAETPGTPSTGTSTSTVSNRAARDSFRLRVVRSGISPAVLL